MPYPGRSSESPALTRSPKLPSSVSRAGRAVALAATACLPLSGCGGDAGIRPGDIRHYRVPSQATRAPARVPARAQPVASAARPALRFELPPGWSDRGGGGGMRLATLVIGDAADGNEVTVIPASGSLRGNVERWQRQLTDSAADDVVGRAVDAALAEADSVDVEGRTATVVLLDDAPGTDPGRTAILAAVIPLDQGDDAIFVKFKGAADVARRERDRFREFVASIRLPRPDTH